MRFGNQRIFAFIALVYITGIYCNDTAKSSKIKCKKCDDIKQTATKCISQKEIGECDGYCLLTKIDTNVFKKDCVTTNLATKSPKRCAEEEETCYCDWDNCNQADTIDYLERKVELKCSNCEAADGLCEKEEKPESIDCINGACIYKEDENGNIYRRCESDPIELKYLDYKCTTKDGSKTCPCKWDNCNEDLNGPIYKNVELNCKECKGADHKCEKEGEIGEMTCNNGACIYKEDKNGTISRYCEKNIENIQYKCAIDEKGVKKCVCNWENCNEKDTSLISKDETESTTTKKPSSGSNLVISNAILILAMIANKLALI